MCIYVPVCTHTQIHGTPTNVSDWLYTKAYASEDTFPSFKAGAPGVAILFQAESHPIWLWWEDDSISIPCVFPPGSGRRSISLTPKTQLWTDTIRQIFLSDVCSHSAVFCLPFGRGRLRGSPGVSLLPSPEFKRSTAPNMTAFFTTNFQIPGDILRELGRVWWVKFHIKRKVPSTTYGEEKKFITKLQIIPLYLY